MTSRTNDPTGTRRRINRDDVDYIRNKPLVPSWQKWREIGGLILGDLKAHGYFFKTASGLIYFGKEERRAFALHEDMALAAMISRRYGINPKEYGFKRVLADIQSEAITNGLPTEVRRLAHYERSTRHLYVSRFDGSMYKLDGDSITQQDNGTDDVFFLDDLVLWEPYQYSSTARKGQLDKQLIESVNFENGILNVAEQRLFLKLWVMAVFFGNVQPTKIILLLLGEQGSGKTSALRRIQKLIFGPRVNLFSIEKDKQDGFIATVTADPIALFDNLDERISWLPYSLSRLATGVTISRRQLYTTNDQVEFPGVSWLGITARSVDFMRDQPDLPDRTLVLKLGRLVERKAEEELLCDVEVHRNAIWSELLEELNRIVRRLRENPDSENVQFRMADFALLATKIADLWGLRDEVQTAFAKLETAQADLVLAEEPISLMLGLWLENVANHGRAVSAGELFEDLATIAEKAGSAWPFANAKVLAQRIGQLRTALNQEYRVEVTWNTHDKQNIYRFWPTVLQDEAKIANPERAESCPDEEALVAL
jgi:hypothetical protein